ncbi:MAG TPA: serine hydrolase domain-containing protein [Phenylobacterium sp.]|nr:serine hydrolase domain-containing protein [Phenylobacterium sp.]
MDGIATAIEAYVDADRLAGAATLVWRDGRVVQDCAVGWRDMDATVLMTRDTIFRIASMTKPITSVAALMLMEEGRFALDDPISRWAPEFADMRVLRSPAGPLDETDPAEREITFDDLLTHRSGLTYADIQAGPIDGAYRAALGGAIDTEVTPDAWIAGLAALPLIDQPGAGFHYGHSTDLLGLLIARMEGASLGEVLERRIFRPLGMRDTGFIVPEGKWDRRSRMYGFDEAGRLTARDTLASEPYLAERPRDMAFESGGQGLWSTVDDYLAFARLFVGEGAVDRVRLLKPDTLALMTANRLTEDQRARAENFGMPLFTAHGFGLGLAVVMDPETASVTRCKGGVGAVGWPGAYGGWWQADPTDGSVMVFLAHNSFELEQLAKGIGLDVYGAITRFHALASAPH